MSEPTINPATQALNETLASAFADKDFGHVGEFFALEAMLLPPRGRAVQGRDAIAAFWLGYGNRFSGITFSTVDVRLIGEAVARETGTYTSAGVGDQAQTAQGKYLFVWEKSDDEWRIESCIWSRNPGGQGQGQGGQGQGGQGQGPGQGGPGQGRPGAGGRGGIGGGRPGGPNRGRPGGGGPQGQPARRPAASYEQSTGLYSDLEG